MKTNCNVEIITLSSIRYYRGYMPIGILTNDDGKEVAYLSPFRGYSFQVSETFEGQSDLGSTQVFGLNNLLDARLGTDRNIGYQSNLRMESIKLYLLELAAKEAIEKFCENTWMLTKEYGVETVRVFHDTKCESFLGDGKKLPLLFGATMLQRFTALCVKWLAPSLYEQYTSDCDMEAEAQRSIEYHIEQLNEAIEPKDYNYHRKAIEKIKADLEEINAMCETMKEVV